MKVGRFTITRDSVPAHEINPSPAHRLLNKHYDRLIITNEYGNQVRRVTWDSHQEPLNIIRAWVDIITYMMKNWRKRK